MLPVDMYNMWICGQHVDMLCIACAQPVDMWISCGLPVDKLWITSTATMYSGAAPEPTCYAGSSSHNIDRLLHMHNAVLPISPHPSNNIAHRRHATLHSAPAKSREA